MNKRCRKSFLVVLLCAAMLVGCSVPDSITANLPIKSDTTETEGNEMTTLGLTPEFLYEVPLSLPNIMTDQLGYAKDSNKVAVFRGEILPYTYHIVDAETKKVVYTGNIERKTSDTKNTNTNNTDTNKTDTKNADTKNADTLNTETIGYGDFTDFTTEGSYYLQADRIGESYSFVIEENPYADIFQALQKQYYYNRCGFTLSTELAGEAAHNACHTNLAQLKEDATIQLDVSGGWHRDENGNREVEEACQAINSLLLAYELHGNVFTDDIGIPESGNGIPDVIDEVKYEVNWLLKMQDATSGAVYSAVSVIDNQMPSYILYTENITMDATIAFAATMAKFSYLYQTYDRAFATQCLKAADRAYRYAGQYRKDVSPEAYFFAAVELYRATGNYTYRMAAHEYLNQTNSLNMENDFVFYGATTYLSTKQKVDVELCDKVIRILLKEVEEIAYQAKNSDYLVKNDKEQSNNDELLQNMARLTVVDHIITNHEYATVLENHLHYFLGRNEQSISYIDNAGDRNYSAIDEKLGIMKQIDLNAELILLMSTIQQDVMSD